MEKCTFIVSVFLANWAKQKAPLQTHSSLTDWFIDSSFSSKYLYGAAMPQRLEMMLSIIKYRILEHFTWFKISKCIQIAMLVQGLRQFCRMGGLCLFVELHRKGSAPAACEQVCYTVNCSHFKFCLVHVYMCNTCYKLIYTKYATVWSIW